MTAGTLDRSGTVLGSGTLPRPSLAALAEGRPDFGRISRFFGRAGPAATTALFTLGAVVAAEALHFAVSAARGRVLDPARMVEIAFVAACVALPVIGYAQHVIRKLAVARRAEKAMVQKLALALDAAEQASRSNRTSSRT